jgi:hypothetical protein
VSQAPGTNEPQESPEPLAGTRPARYPRTANGLIGSMIVVLLVIGAFVVLRALNRNDLEVRPEAVDYLATVQDLQDGDLAPVYPPELPEGWIATSIDYVPGERPSWGIGMLTDAERFVGVRQEDASLDDLLHTYVDEDPVEGDSVTLEGSIAPTWQTYTDAGGDRAYAAEVGDDWVLVYGSASRADQEELIGLLTTRPAP